MTSRPLLVFPNPDSASRTKRPRPVTPPHYPSATRQGERLRPVFKRLQNYFVDKNIELSKTPSGIEPEQVLVIETVGSIENFSNAVKKISGLEWLGEIEIDEIIPDEDFYIEDRPDKELSGRLYLIMTNQQALNQMLSLWNRYQRDTNMKFERGLTKFRDVFIHLKDIRKWGVQDRLAENEIFEIWKENIEFDRERRIIFEAELWFRGDNQKRSESSRIVTDLITDLGGSIISQSIISEIAYHSILGEISVDVAEEILQNPNIDLLKCENIMFFRPTGQISTGRGESEGVLGDTTNKEHELPSGDPILAVLDGYPLANHTLLSDRIIIDDPDDWATGYPAFDRQHGTAMSSLIIHGDLNEESNPLGKPIYLRPILKPIDWHQSPRPEFVPEDILFIDYLHAAIKRIIEGDESEEAVAPTVKIINLSIGDQCRHFSQIISPLAKLLDWLSYRYNILFMVSSGNHSRSIDTGLSESDFISLTESEKESLIVKKIYEDIRHRKLLSPGESINALTIGATHEDDSSSFILGQQINTFTSHLPSPVSAFGSGYRRSIKPDLIYKGGRILFSREYNDSNMILQTNNRRIAPGNLVASPSAIAGELTKSKYCCGSSNATALMSRNASLVYETLKELLEEKRPDLDFELYDIPLLKALLIHSCSWSELGDNLGQILNDIDSGRQIRSWISRWIGYGVPSLERIMSCNDQRATLIGFGQLNEEEAHIYKLPLPPTLSAQRVWRKFTVTLAWISPISPTTQKYRSSQLWFDFEGGKSSRSKLNEKLRVSGIDSDPDATRRGTVQHEIFEGEDAIAITDGDSVQIKVNCKRDASKITKPISYGLVVSFEVAEGIEIPIYNEIQTRISLPVEIHTIK